MGPIKHGMAYERLELIFPIQTGRQEEGFVMKVCCQFNLAIRCRDTLRLILLKQIQCSLQHRGWAISYKGWANAAFVSKHRNHSLSLQERNWNWKASHCKNPDSWRWCLENSFFDFPFLYSRKVKIPDYHCGHFLVITYEFNLKNAKVRTAQRNIVCALV